MMKHKQWTEVSNEIFRNEGKRTFPRYQWFKDHMESPGKLLEIGFNSGEALSWYAGIGFECTGIELPRLAVRGNDQRIRYMPINIDSPNADELASLFNEEFDYVILAEVLQHLIFDENCLYAIWHYLKPGGKLLISTEAEKLKSHALRYYDKIGLIRTLEALQFKLEDVSTRGQSGYIWLCVKKQTENLI